MSPPLCNLTYHLTLQSPSASRFSILSIGLLWFAGLLSSALFLAGTAVFSVKNTLNNPRYTSFPVPSERHAKATA